MPTLLQINVTLNAGSTGRLAEGIGRAALDAGWRSVIAYGRSARPSASESLRLGSPLGLFCHGLQTRLLDRHGQGSSRATRDLIDAMVHLRPDVVHLHNLHGYYLNVPMLFAHLRAARLPVVWTLHDAWPVTGHCAYFTFVACERWKSQCFSCPQQRIYPASWARDRSRPNHALKRRWFADMPNLRLVTPSRWLKGVVQESFLRPYPVEVIPNGIDLSVFHPVDPGPIRRKYALGSSRIVLGVASPWNIRKGLDSFVRLARDLPPDLRIVLVGLSPRQLRALPPGIVGIQRTENVEDLRALYSAADVLANPTKEDNFPSVNLEAMACGTPVVAFDVGGATEALDHLTGESIPPGDHEAWATAVARWAREGRSTRSDACVRRASTLFDERRQAKACVDLYGFGKTSASASDPLEDPPDT